MRIKCSNCNARFDIDKKVIDTKLEWMMCPVCGSLSHNPLYNGNA